MHVEFENLDFVTTHEIDKMKKKNRAFERTMAYRDAKIEEHKFLKAFRCENKRVLDESDQLEKSAETFVSSIISFASTCFLSQLAGTQCEHEVRSRENLEP